MKWLESSIESRIGISVHFNEVFNTALKAAVPSAKFNREKSAWFFDEEAKEDVVPLLEKFYINTKPHRITWQLDRDYGVTIDGARVLFVSRDYWNFTRGSFPFKALESNLSTGGSRNNPRVSGRLVIEVQLREGAILDPEPESIELIEEKEAKNLLEAFPTSMLVDELKRRGATSPQ